MRISVVVVSRNRPQELRRCLVACSQLFGADFEMVVVADGSGLSAISGLPFADTMKTTLFDVPNISEARNIGIAQAGGDIIAFIDDDAVPEPNWLNVLESAFTNAGVAAVSGAVRGRNGISFQSLQPWIARDGVTHEDPDVPQNAVPKLVGTNMAIRREALVAIGGFDQRFQFFLEDADISLRLADAGFRLAHCPDAQVHHAFAPSSRRRADRMPTKLDDVGRSAVVFLERHAPPDHRPMALERFRAAEHHRLIRHMVWGSCEPRDVTRLMDSFDRGIAEGRAGKPEVPVKLAEKQSFHPFGTAPEPRPHVVFAGRWWHRARVRAEAEAVVRQGVSVSAFVFSRSTIFHRVRFDDAGFWLQTGGQFGRSVRSEPLFSPKRLKNRVDQEWARVKNLRCPREATQSSQIRWI